MTTCAELPCADGSDRHCFEEVRVCILIDVPEEEMLEAYESGELDVTKRQLLELGLDPEDYGAEDFDEDDLVTITSEDAGIVAEVCGACGSDQYYDDEGNNITGM